MFEIGTDPPACVEIEHFRFLISGTIVFRLPGRPVVAGSSAFRFTFPDQAV
jgi:hypothetical protein